MIPGRLQDIQDGKLYIEHMQHGGFLTIPENTGLILCSDGIQLFKSSKQAIWPVLLLVTSLPPGIRMNMENVIVAGLWQGPTKPPMNVILAPVLEKIQHLRTHGIIAHTPNGLKTIRATLLMSVFDLPAKAAATNFVQFNGYYSCTYCLDKGEYVSHCHIFPPSADHLPRTMQSIIQCAEEAIETGSPVLGVKGASALATAGGLNIATSVAVDYMHAVLEGISHRLIATFLDSKFHNRCFYLGQVTQDIDVRLQLIKPPEEFRRSPRSITQFKSWKASEFREWLLYYSLPVLSGLLPSNYIYHLSLLVASMHIFLGDAITMTDIEVAHGLVMLFYQLIPELYPASMCTANVHNLIHLSDCVKNWGPLWCYSCFGFENMNGHLRKYCHGTGYVLPQLIQNVRLHQVLPQLSSKIVAAGTGRFTLFVESMAMNGISNRITCDTEIKSRIIHSHMDENVAEALWSAGHLKSLHTCTLPTCTKIRHKKINYSIAKKNKRRDGSVCVFIHQSQLFFGSIIQMCFSEKNLVAVLQVIEELDDTIFNHIRPSTHPKLNSDSCSKINDFCFIAHYTDQLLAVPVSCIQAKCICIPLHASVGTIQYYCVFTLPNSFEHH